VSIWFQFQPQDFEQLDSIGDAFKDARQTFYSRSGALKNAINKH